MRSMLPLVHNLAKFVVSGIVVIWLCTGAIAAEVQKPTIDMHSDQATVPVWVFATTMLAAIIATAGATWAIARAVARLEFKIETLEHSQQHGNGEG